MYLYLGYIFDRIFDLVCRLVPFLIMCVVSFCDESLSLREVNVNCTRARCEIRYGWSRWM